MVSKIALSMLVEIEKFTWNEVSPKLNENGYKVRMSFKRLKSEFPQEQVYKCLNELFQKKLLSKWEFTKIDNSKGFFCTVKGHHVAKYYKNKTNNQKRLVHGN